MTIQRTSRLRCRDARCRILSTRSRAGSMKATPCCTRAARNTRRNLSSMAFLSGQPLAELRSGDRSRRRAVHEHLYRRHSRGIWPENGRRGRSQHACRITQPGFHGQVGAFRRQLRHRRRFREGQYVWGKNIFGAQRQRQHDRPLSESGRPAELHEHRHHWATFRPTTSAT